MFSPSLRREATPLCVPNMFTVITFAYDGGRRTWAHRTLKAAHRRLASAVAGMLSARAEYAAFIVTPDGEMLSYHEARNEIDHLRNRGMTMTYVRPAHFFPSSIDGALYDTRIEGWSSGHPLSVRPNYMMHHHRINSAADLKATLRAGSTTDLGGYPLYLVTLNGEVVSFAAVLDNLREYLDAYMGNDWYRRANRIVGCDVNWEDGLYCDVTGVRIPSAYGTDDEQQEDDANMI